MWDKDSGGRTRYLIGEPQMHFQRESQPIRDEGRDAMKPTYKIVKRVDEQGLIRNGMNRVGKQDERGKGRT